MMHSIVGKHKLLYTIVTLAGGWYILRRANSSSKYASANCDCLSSKENSLSSHIHYVRTSGSYLLLSWNLWRLPWTESDIPVYWKLLMLAKSRNHNVRHLAVRALAEANLEEFQYTMVAQACDKRTAVALARMMNISSHFFLSPPFKDLHQGNLISELLQLLNSLPLSDVNPCTRLYTQRAISMGNNFSFDCEEWNTEIEDLASIYHLNVKRTSDYLFKKVSLQAILEHSAIQSHRALLIENGVLKMLHKILFSHNNELEFQSLISQILANFALEEKFSEHIHVTGWIGILASWMKSPYIEVNLPAARALANLDTDDYPHILLDNGIYLMHPQFRQKENIIGADVIFVHGMLGGAFWTWRQNDCKRITDKNIKGKPNENAFENYTFCWPKDWLAFECPHLRLISVDYNTCVSKWKSKCPPERMNGTLNGKAKEVLTKLISSGIGRRPIIWITHSMGGLLVKQMLIEAEASEDVRFKSVASETTGVVFYSVPHKGSEIANVMHSANILFQPSVDIQLLRKDSPNLLDLNEKFKKFINKNNVAVLSFGETVKSKLGLNWNAILVTSDSSNPGVGEFFELPVNHLSTCKPISPDSEMYTKLVNFIQSCCRNRRKNAIN